MKTLSEEINEIKNAKISKTAKRTALAKLGLLKSDVEIVMSSMPAPEARGSRFAFRNILAPVVREYGLRSPELTAAVDAIIGGSRFAFLRVADVLTFGKWFEMDGCLYSNLTWRYYVNNRRFVYSPTA